MRRALKNSLKVILIMVLTIGLVELYFQITAIPLAKYVWQPNFKVEMNVADNVMPGVEGKSIFSINNEGLRGDLKSNQSELKILTVGGSTTECFYLDNEDAWPRVLQKLLNQKKENLSWVGNIGRSGLNSEHHLLTLKEGIEQYGDIDMIIFLFGINDLIKDLNHSKNIYIDNRSIEEQTFMYTVNEDTLSLIEKSELYKKISSTFAQSKMDTEQVSHVQNLSGTIYNKWRQNRFLSNPKIQQIPDLDEELNEYKSNIQEIIEICQDKSIRPIFLTQPTIYKPNMKDDLKNLCWLGGLGNFQGSDSCTYYDIDVLYHLMNQYNEVLIKVCEEKRLDLIHLDRRLSKDTTTFYDDCHFNIEGAKKVAHEIYNYLNASKTNDALK